MSRENPQYRLAARPDGLPKPSDWDFVTEPAGEPGDGQVLVEVDFLSLDPAMRGWMNDVRSYIPPVGIGEVMRAVGAGHVVASRSDRFAEGDHVTGAFGIQRYAVTEAAALTKIDTDLADPTVHLGTLGMSGLTAYFGMLDIGKPGEGDTVVVSGAAGAVGTVAGQVAKIKGARVVGIAGGPEKCAFLTDELGFDAAVDYKAGNLASDLKAATPDRIDVFFDNVGGEILDGVLLRIGRGARIVICGAISQYNNKAAVTGPANYLQLLVERASMTGMVIFDYADRFGEAVTEMAGWIADGSLRSKEHIVDGGIEAFPDTLLKLFAGENTGKLMLRV